jgi:hypothetical protein
MAEPSVAYLEEEYETMVGNAKKYLGTLTKWLVVTWVCSTSQPEREEVIRFEKDFRDEKTKWFGAATSFMAHCGTVEILKSRSDPESVDRTRRRWVCHFAILLHDQS